MLCLTDIKLFYCVELLRLNDVSEQPIGPKFKCQAAREGCPETSVTKCHSSLRNIPEARRTLPHISAISATLWLVLQAVLYGGKQSSTNIWSQIAMAPNTFENNSFKRVFFFNFNFNFLFFYFFIFFRISSNVSQHWFAPQKCTRISRLRRRRIWC